MHGTGFGAGFPPRGSSRGIAAALQGHPCRAPNPRFTKSFRLFESRKGVGACQHAGPQGSGCDHWAFSEALHIDEPFLRIAEAVSRRLPHGVAGAAIRPPERQNVDGSVNASMPRCFLRPQRTRGKRLPRKGSASPHSRRSSRTPGGVSKRNSDASGEVFVSTDSRRTCVRLPSRSMTTLSRRLPSEATTSSSRW